jgi:uncharacterized membrane protein
MNKNSCANIHSSVLPFTHSSGNNMARNLLTDAQEQQLVEAIQKAEEQTSGEIKLHIERTCSKENVLDRAVEVFGMLHMHQTLLRNGVLFYVAYESHKFAVIGDEGINAVVPDDFWDKVKQTVLAHFVEEKYAEGLSLGILMAGDQLKTYFPYDEKGDLNELPDDISYGKTDKE